ncbi:MAG TPA: CopL family metal-binding regulatory protein [Xanthomonadaceae bacterium]
MSPLAVLLRLLLCIALILNGSVPAVHAAMSGTAPQASQDAPAVDPGADDDADMTMGEGGCHDGGMAHDPSPVDTPAPSDPDEADTDCCGGDGDCRSTCAQHCAVSIPSVAVLDLIQLPAAGPLPTQTAAQPDPRLRDRIRPPIA